MTRARKLIMAIPLTLMMVLSACTLWQPAPVAPSPTIVSTTQVPTVAPTATVLDANRRTANEYTSTNANRNPNINSGGCHIHHCPTHSNHCSTRSANH